MAAILFFLPSFRHSNRTHMAHHLFAVHVATLPGEELKIALDPVLPDVQEAFEAAALAEWPKSRRGTRRLHSSIVVRRILHVLCQTKRGADKHELERCRELLRLALHKHAKARVLLRSELLTEGDGNQDSAAIFRVCHHEPGPRRCVRDNQGIRS